MAERLRTVQNTYPGTCQEHNRDTRSAQLCLSECRDVSDRPYVGTCMCRLEPTRDGRARTISLSCGILRARGAPTDHLWTALATDGPIFSCAASDRPHAAHLSSCWRGQHHRKIAPQPAAAPRWATVWPRNRCKTASQSRWPATSHSMAPGERPPRVEKCRSKSVQYNVGPKGGARPGTFRPAGPKCAGSKNPV